MRSVCVVLTVCLFFQLINISSFGLLFAQQRVQVDNIPRPIFPESTVNKDSKTDKDTPKRFINNKEGFGIMEMVACKESKNNIYLKITPAPETRREWLDKENPSRLSNPEDYIYVKFEKCKYKVNSDYIFEVYDCTLIPSFSNASEYWNLSDILKRIKTGFKFSEICYNIGNTLLAVAACMVGGSVFAGWYESAVTAGSGAVALSAAGVSAKLIVVDVLGAMVGGMGFDSVKDVTTRKTKNDLKHACITSDKRLDEADALKILLNSEFVSGLWPIAIDSEKIISLSSLIDIVGNEMMYSQTKARKQIWKVDGTGKPYRLGVPQLNLEIPRVQEYTVVPNSTYITPHVGKKFPANNVENK